jgi:hypothetical protein
MKEFTTQDMMELVEWVSARGRDAADIGSVAYATLGQLGVAAAAMASIMGADDPKKFGYDPPTTLELPDPTLEPGWDK